MNARLDIPLNYDRKAGGYPLIRYNEKPVVFADALALLSGVNFSSVEKVLAAMSLIQETTQQDIDSLMFLGDVPTERVVIGQRAYAKRAANTAAFVKSLVSDLPISQDVAEILKLRDRFPEL